MVDGYGDYMNDQYDIQDDRSKNLDVSYLIMKQLDTIRLISSREFHIGIKLYQDDGLLSGYVPDVLESYISAINNLSDMISVYSFQPAEIPIINDRKKMYENARKELRRCIMKIKRLGILPTDKKLWEQFSPRKRGKENKEDGESELFKGVDPKAY